MNRMISIPMVIGFMFLFVAILGGVAVQDVEPERDKWGTYIDEDGNVKIIEIPQQEEESTFSLMSPDGLMAVLIIAMAVGIVSGVTVFSSGLSELSQSIVFQTTIYLAIWAVISMAMYDIVNTIPEIGALLWLSMTAVYCIGVAQEVKT